jgi:hypothetical protein
MFSCRLLLTLAADGQRLACVAPSVLATRAGDFDLDALAADLQRAAASLGNPVGQDPEAAKADHAGPNREHDQGCDATIDLLEFHDAQFTHDDFLLINPPIAGDVKISTLTRVSFKPPFSTDRACRPLIGWPRTWREIPL